MADPQYVYETMQRAIAILTAWTSGDPDSGDFRGDVLLSYVEEGVRDEDLVLGFMNVSGVLLMKLEKHAGLMPDVVLQDIAQRYRPKE